MNWVRNHLLICLYCIVLMQISGCAQFAYYAQAAQGQFSLLSEAKPVEDWLDNPEVSNKLKVKLTQAKAIRQFAIHELGLPDNDSYKNYIDLKRPFVLWNVVATPELSLNSKQWCFPVSGCVNYRGYYSKQEAQDYAAQLRKQGEDVQISGVPAYSTLGWFNDPLISTFIQYPNGELAKLIFHELAHQVVYVPGDTQFNESFATAVEEIGVQRWLEHDADATAHLNYALSKKRKDDFLSLLLKHRLALQLNYSNQISDAEKRQKKSAIFQAMKEEYQLLKATWDGYDGYDRWFDQPLSNAHLALVAAYNDFVPGFKALLAREKSFPQFYAAVQALSVLDKATRHQQLKQLTEFAQFTQSAALN